MGHIQDDLIERYSMDRLTEPELSEVEEHLLTCTQCQERVEAEDRFTRAARAALSRPESAVSEPKPSWQPMRNRWLGLAFAGALALLMYFLLPTRTRTTQSQTVQLMAVRGTGDAGRARTGIPLLLELDTASLQPGAYSANVTDAAGNSIWKKDVTVSGSRLDVRVDASLTAGKYWVHLYNGSDLIREFSLLVE